MDEQLGSVRAWLMWYKAGCESWRQGPCCLWNNEQPLSQNWKGAAWGFSGSFTKEIYVSRRFSRQPSQPLGEHQGLFLKMLPFSGFRSTTLRRKIWGFAIVLKGVEQVLIKSFFFIQMRCNRVGTEKGLARTSSLGEFLWAFGSSFPGASLFYSFQ